MPTIKRPAYLIILIILIAFALFLPIKLTAAANDTPIEPENTGNRQVENDPGWQENEFGHSASYGPEENDNNKPGDNNGDYTGEDLVFSAETTPIEITPANQTTTPDFVSDAFFISSLDNRKLLCSLDTTYIYVSNLASTKDWTMTLLFMKDGVFRTENHTFDTKTAALLYGPEASSGYTTFCFVKAVDDKEYINDSYDLTALFDKTKHQIEFNWNREPIANAALSYTAAQTNPIEITFSASADFHEHNNAVCAGNITYNWDFGDGDTQTTSTPTVQHTYAFSSDSKYTATVTISGSKGGNASATKEVYAGYALAVPEELCTAEPLVFNITNPNWDGNTLWTAEYTVKNESVTLASGTITSNTETYEVDLGTAVWNGLFVTTNSADIGKQKPISVHVTKIDDEPVNYNGTVNVLYWLRKLIFGPNQFKQLLDNPFSFQLTPIIETHCPDCTITSYYWTIGYSQPNVQYKYSTDKNPVLTFTVPTLNLFSLRVALITANGLSHDSATSSYSNAIMGALDPNANPALVLSNSRICRYETPQMSVTNRDFVGGTWFFTLTYNGGDYTYGPIDEKTAIININFLGDNPTLGEHELTVTKINGIDVTGTPSKAIIKVEKAVSADFLPVVTPGILTVNFIALVDLHHPTTGGEDCAGVGKNTKTYEWIFDTGNTPAGTNQLFIVNTYTNAGSKTVTLNVFDKHDANADTVTKPITLTGGGLTLASFDVIYNSGTSATVSNMPANDLAVAVNSEYTVPANIPERNSYSFTGWLCSVDGRTYLPGSFFTMPDKNIVLAAQWKRDSSEPKGPKDPVTPDSQQPEQPGATTSSKPAEPTEPTHPEGSGNIQHERNGQPPATNGGTLVPLGDLPQTGVYNAVTLLFIAFLAYVPIAMLLSVIIRKKNKRNQQA